MDRLKDRHLEIHPCVLQDIDPLDLLSKKGSTEHVTVDKLDMLNSAQWHTMKL